MIKKYILILFTFSFLFSINNKIISNEKYIAGDDGVIRMYVNIIGHVKTPGTYLVYDKIDLMSVLSIAGGYLQGSDLKNIIVYSEDGTNKKIDLNKILNSNASINEALDLKPHDTIYVDQKGVSRFFISSNLPTIILSLINVIVSVKNSN